MFDAPDAPLEPPDRLGAMISYEPLWRTMEQCGASTYTLQVKGGISSSTIRRIKAGDSISTNSIDALCAVLGCRVEEVIEHIDDVPPPAVP